MPRTPSVPTASAPSPCASPTPDAERAPLAVHILLDRSGSMHDIADDVVGGLNALVAEQQAAPSAPLCHVTLAQFDSEDPLEILWSHRPAAALRALARDVYRPRGATPLFDALWTLLDRAEQDADVDTDHLVVVITDGQENASVRHDRRDVLARIESLTGRGWAFAYLSADPSAFADAHAIGVSASNTDLWRKDREGVRDLFALASTAMSAYADQDQATRRSKNTSVVDDAKATLADKEFCSPS